METLKILINKKFKTVSLITGAIMFCIIILMVRIKLNKSFFYLFLVWNIFLAIIPYVITMYLSAVKLTRIKLILWFCVWLLFLPNAPYIITDLLHLKVSDASMLWLDILVILSFALCGLFLFYISILDMLKLLIHHFKKTPKQLLIISIIFLSSFGVYLGRFLRYNSWGILSHPKILVSDVLNIITSPFKNYEAWLFTIGFGGFLVVGYWVFNELSKTNNNNLD